MLLDVIIIGAGAIGSAIARELSRYKLKIAVLEKWLDVACETSGRNSGVVHAGFNNKPGTLMAKFCVQGCNEFESLARELDVPFKRTGKLVLGFTKADLGQLEKLKSQGDRNKAAGLKIIYKEEIKKIEPNIEGNAALYSPMTGIFNPFIYNIALAENACQNGVNYFFNNEVESISRKKGRYVICAGENRYETRWVINSAGLYADKIAAMAGIKGYKIYPCRGEYFVLDKEAGQYLKTPAYPVPNESEGGLGIHLTPTIDGNIIIGPSAEYIESKDDYATTKEIMEMLISEGRKILPNLKKEHFIRSFAGIRPKLVAKQDGGYGDFVILQSDCAPDMINLIGMESPGLTASAAIAKEVACRIKQKQRLIKNDKFNPIRKGILCFSRQTDQEKARLISENPNYGEIVCRCEAITRQEVLDALDNPLGVETVGGIKNRTRAMMGRCQGGFCQTRISEIIMQKNNREANQVIFNGFGGKMFFKKVRP